LFDASGIFMLEERPRGANTQRFQRLLSPIALDLERQSRKTPSAAISGHSSDAALAKSHEGKSPV
jgi:hypothetical protein